jgi:hypothetical protein
MSDAAWIAQIDLADDGAPDLGEQGCRWARATAVPGCVEPHPRRQRKPVGGQEKPDHERGAARAGQADRLGGRRTSRQGW